MRKIIAIQILTLLIIFHVTVLIVQADTWTGKCVGVADGDTITVMKEARPIKIRLYGIDCPEKGQSFYRKAKEFTADSAFGKIVRVDGEIFDRYRRLIAWVYVGDFCLNRELLRAGLAWHYKKYSQEDDLAQLETIARARKEGLWREEGPTPPWEFRR